MLKWLRRRCEVARRAAEDANRLRKRNDQAELSAGPTQSKNLRVFLGSPCEQSAP